MEVLRIHSYYLQGATLYEALGKLFSIPTLEELSSWDLEQFYGQWSDQVFSGPVVYQEWAGGFRIVTDASQREITIVARKATYEGEPLANRIKRVTCDFGGSVHAAGRTIARLRESGAVAEIITDDGKGYSVESYPGPLFKENGGQPVSEQANG